MNDHYEMQIGDLKERIAELEKELKSAKIMLIAAYDDIYDCEDNHNDNIRLIIGKYLKIIN